MKWTVLLTTAVLTFACVGCKDRQAPQERTVAEDTDVEDKLFGGTEIDQKEVIEKNGQYEVREKETELDDQGNVTEQEIKISPPKRDAEVEVRGDERGVSVDVNTRDEE